MENPWAGASAIESYVALHVSADVELETMDSQTNAEDSDAVLSIIMLSRIATNLIGRHALPRQKLLQDCHVVLEFDHFCDCRVQITCLLLSFLLQAMYLSWLLSQDKTQS